MNLNEDPWAIDPDKFGLLLNRISEDPDDCGCDTCTFVNLIPSMLDAEGVEP